METKKDIDKSLFRSFFEVTTDMFCIANFEGNFEVINNKWSECLGWTKSELLAKPFMDFVHPDDIQKTIDQYSKCKASDPAIRFINRYKHKNGSYRYLSWSSVTDFSANKVFASARDITKEIQNEMILSEMQEIAKIGAWSYDFPNDSLRISEGINKIFGLENQKDVKEKVLACFPEEDRKQLLKDMKFAHENRSSFDHEYSIKTINGENKKVHIQGHPVAENGLEHLSGTVQDITQSYYLRQDRETMTLQLLQSSKLASLGEISGNIAHEINNPLAIIQGLSNQLSRLHNNPDKVSPEKLAKTALRIEKTTKRIADIVKSLRSFSRDASRDPYIDSPVTEIVEDAMSLVKERFINHNKVLLYKTPKTELNMVCKPSEISQVLLNLLNNSFDAIKDEEAGLVEIETLCNGTYTTIIVSDNGPGISQEYQEQVFDPFFTTKPMGQGTGLGLSISKSIVNRHSGDFFFESNNNGTRFFIKVPCTRQV